MKKQIYGNKEAWFGAEDTPAPQNSIANPAPKLTVAVSTEHRNAKVMVRYRRPNTNWQKLEIRKSHRSTEAQYFSTRFPRTEPGIRVEYEVLVRLSGTESLSEQRVGEICWFETAVKTDGSGDRKGAGITGRDKSGDTPDVLSLIKTESDAVAFADAKRHFDASGAITADAGFKFDSGNEEIQTEVPFWLNSRDLKRLNCLKRCQNTQKANEKLDELFQKAEGDFTRLYKLMEESSDFDEAAIRQIRFANDLADLTGDDESLVEAFLADHKTNCIRDIALNLKKEELDSFAGNTTREKKNEEKTVELRDRLFRMAPNHVIHRMTRDREIELDEPVRSGLLAFFEANPELDFRKDSVLKVLNQPESLKYIPEAHREKVVKSLKGYQRLSAVSPKAEALPKLMKVGLDSAYAINEVPLERFIALYSDSLGGENVAGIIHAEAQKRNVLTENTLIALHDVMRSPSVNMIHGGQSADTRSQLAIALAQQKNIPINFETLFGSVDLCECKHCNSVYSPAAYLVELFQYLRNNNLDPDNPNTGKEGIDETPLQMLFRRRPDLGRLQLTCENTNTLIPYIDLVNEVMESFVYYLEHYEENTQTPKQAIIAAHNVNDESSGELLAEAQKTDYRAYNILHQAIYPVCRLPYHQPIDAARQYLKFLKTSRYELFNAFRKDVSYEPEENASNAEIERLSRMEELQVQSVDRAIAAEYLGLTEEEYVILTKEGFHTREWYELDEQSDLTPVQYRNKIRLKDTWAYYGIESNNKMLNELKWVKPPQTTGMVGFLRRVNIEYADLIELLKTRYINPDYLSGRALAYMNSLSYSYRYLQTLVDGNQQDIKLKYRRLVQFLQDDLKAGFDPRFDGAYVECWVYKYFAKIGKLIVLENASSPATSCQCIEGDFRLPVINLGDDAGSFITLSIDLNCKMFIANSNPKKWVGSIDTATGKLEFDKDFLDGFAAVSNQQPISFTGKNGENGIIQNWVLHLLTGSAISGLEPFTCIDPKDHRETCDISKTQLKHLDGTDLITSEYDRMHRFIRLWCKLDWTIAEVDQAITGVGETVNNPVSGIIGFPAGKKFKAFEPSLPSGKDDWKIFGEMLAVNLPAIAPDPLKKTVLINHLDISPAFSKTKLTALPSGRDPDPSGNTYTANLPAIEPEKDCKPQPISQILQDITPYLIEQLVAVKKLQETSGLELAKLLTFWTSIGTEGEKPLYERLFLQYNLIAEDEVFQEVRYGTYLTQGASISDHLPAIMAAFKVDVAMLETIMSYAGIEDSLTLENVSHIYRHVLLAKSLGLRIKQLPALFELLKKQVHPFSQPTHTLGFYQLFEHISKSGFDTRQLNYMIRNEDDPDRPLRPQTGDMFRLAISLRDALLQIETDHADISHEEEATEEFLRNKLSLLFDDKIVEQIINLVQGTSVYEDNTRRRFSAKLEPGDQDVILAFLQEERKKEAEHPGGELKTFLQRVQFSNEKGLQVTGILNEADRTRLSALADLIADDDDREKFEIAVNKILAQPKFVFADVLASIYPDPEDEADAREILLAEDQVDENGGEISAIQKRVFLTRTFLPYLREQLRQRQVVQILTSDLGLDQDIMEKLVMEVIKSEEDEALYHVIIRLKEQKDIDPEDQQTPLSWEGFFVPKQEGYYAFLLETEGDATLTTFANKALWPDGSERTDEEQINFYRSRAILLKAGQTYPIHLQGFDENEAGKIIGLFMRFNDQPQIEISDKYLFPALRTEAFVEAYLRLHKAAMLIKGFNMKSVELEFFLDFPGNFDGLDFNSLNFPQWLRLEAFFRLQKSLPAKQLSLIEFFRWTNTTDETVSDSVLSLTQQINRLTGWQETDVDKLISSKYFNLLQPNHFQDEVNLLKLKDTLKVEQKVGVGIDLLFYWGTPVPTFTLDPKIAFTLNRKIAEDIREAIRARYTQKEWEEAIKPVHDQLRENQKQALIAYLLAQQVLMDWGVRDADSLFEFFLIDVQMDACMETSRIKQAISSVQLYVQRCFLGLEDKYGVGSDILDHQRWEWMSRYRVWEANRKVFLYPENWIRGELRDDKSPFFKELESELLQNDISDEAVKSALTKYIVQVDEVANIEVVGQFLEGDLEKGKLHVIARTRNAPYFFYYRYYEFGDKKYWYPWEKVDVDIPAIDIKDESENLIQNGAFVMPVVWKNRLFIFFPQFMQINWDSPLKRRVKIKDNANNTSEESSTLPYWEIKIGWSEYKEAKWGPKQISDLAIYSKIKWTPEKKTLSSIINSEIFSSYEEETFRLLSEKQKFIFVPFIDEKNGVYIQTYYYGEMPHIIEGLVNENEQFLRICLSFEDAKKYFVNSENAKILSESFVFDGNQIRKVNQTVSNAKPWWWNFQLFEGPPQKIQLEFHRETSSKYLYPIQQVYGQSNVYLHPAFQEAEKSKVILSSNNVYSFQYEGTKDILGLLRKNEIKNMFEKKILLSNDNFGSNDGVQYHELKRPYAIYNWEMLFHGVAMLAENLSKSQRFEESMKWWHYIFDPIDVKDDIRKVWKFLPFRVTDSKNILEKIFSRLEPNTPDTPDTQDDGITEWRDNPFMPHVIARSRPSAYMKWVVMKYIDNLIAWGDSLFRQDTIESINQATQLYILAGHILGPRPEFIPKRGKIKPQTYMSLLDKWDAFSNAMVDLELIFPFSNQIAIQTVDDSEPHYINVYGFATTLYFCIPDNPKLLEYWDTVADRLFKIRHCLNIEGIFRKLNLFEPPIDPALLVQAAAQGLSIGSVLNDLSTPMPNYRFNYLLARALEVTSEVKSLGNALLSALEKKDTESLSILRSQHDTNIQNLIMEVRKKQLEEAEKTRESLEENRKAPVHRLEYYQQLVDEEVTIPDINTEFTLIANTLPEVKDESGMKLIGEEAEEIKKAKQSRDLQIGVGSTEVLSSVFHAIPTITVDAKPFGIGPGAGFGGPQAGSVVQAIARGLQIGVNVTSAQSVAAGRKAGHLRQLHDRKFQANLAGLEITQIDKQITTQQIRIDLAEKEIENHQVQIDQTKEVEDFLRNKFSNDQLYHWMSEQLKNLYYQTYSFAYDLAKKAEKVYRFELGLSTSDFVKFGYWNSAKEGFLAGEQLYLALKQLENAYIEAKPHDYEITKQISLRHVNPLALIQLKEQGVCEFNLEEELFDLDYPGHYKRRIKTVAVSIPCIVGPNTSLNCTLRLLKHEYRNSKVASASNYPKNLEEADERFVTNPIPRTAIAVSQGQNDSGVFELTFQSERYLPFEGSGAISIWRLELPNEFRQFDYQTITDVIIHLRYTSCEGGETLKAAALNHLNYYAKNAMELSKTEGLFRMFSLYHEFPNECHRLLNPEPDAEHQILHLGNLKERFPFFAQSSLINSVEIVDIRLFTYATNWQPRVLKAVQSEMVIENPDFSEDFAPGASVGNLQQYFLSDQGIGLIGFWGIQFNQVEPVTKDQLSNAWLVIKYQLK
jgi:hypothetical protein